MTVDKDGWKPGLTEEEKEIYERNAAERIAGPMYFREGAPEWDPDITPEEKERRLKLIAKITGKN